MLELSFVKKKKVLYKKKNCKADLRLELFKKIKKKIKLHFQKKKVLLVEGEKRILLCCYCRCVVTNAVVKPIEKKFRFYTVNCTFPSSHHTVIVLNSLSNALVNCQNINL